MSGKNVQLFSLVLCVNDKSYINNNNTITEKKNPVKLNALAVSCQITYSNTKYFNCQY
uniref:Uncharacterized protein n=1 Tax=Octopus bimaculoides TaxID=37653 RepID=A0A0L8HV09_OCTBM